MTAAGPYAQAAGDYWSAGWHGALPLPARRKASPPEGWTGRGPGDPSFPDVLAWSEGPEGEGNVGLRMPAHVVGLDVDDYGAKTGGETLASGERAYGPLPATWRTTSRDDGVSGIRLYRVPAGLRWPGTFGPGTEIVCRTHRYAVAPPSIHPEGRTYRWLTPEGVVATIGPTPDDLPELPQGWLVGLTQGRVDDATPKATLGDSEVEAWIAEHDHGGRCDALRTATDRVIAEVTSSSSAHEALHHVPGLLRLALAGHRGLEVELDRLWLAFKAEVTGQRSGSQRDEHEAAGEWNRSVVGAVAIVVGDPQDEPSDRDPCEGPVKLNREHRAAAYAARGDEHDSDWLTTQLRGDVRLLGRAVGTDALDLAEAVGFLGQHATALELVDPDRLDAAITAAIARARVNPETAEAALVRGRERATTRPWRLAGQNETSDGGEDVTTIESTNDGVGQTDAEDEGPTPEQREELAVLREVAEQRRRRDALRRLAAEDAPELRVLDVDAFLDSPGPAPLVPGLLYRDSLARLFGAPGSGKSFAAIDLAMSVALGRSWGGHDVEQGPVFYVMAEGQAVNVVRAKAWLDRHGVDRAALRGRFFTVPDAVMLTEEAARPFVETVRRHGAALVILDTKNAMMVGEESSATDFAVLRRVLDQIRKASGACVVLVDHTGYEGTRARGTSAGTAAMDTEARVENDGESPAGVTVTVTRDKAAEAGASWSFFLRMAGEAAVLVPAEGDERPERESRFTPAWQTAEDLVIPTAVLHYEGKGAKALPDLARFMAHDASPRYGDVGELGVTRAEAVRALRDLHEESSVRRAWSVLVGQGHIDTADGVKSSTGRHVWNP